jgi:hypothetical protein
VAAGQVAKPVFAEMGFAVEILDLSRLTSEFGKQNHSSKSCVSTSVALCRPSGLVPPNRPRLIAWRRLFLRGLRFGVPLFFLAFLHQSVVADHLTDDLHCLRFSLLSEPGHDILLRRRNRGNSKCFLIS